MASAHSVSVLEHCLIPPPMSTAADMSVPLSFFDMIWLHFSPIQRLVLYEYPQLSRAHFIDNIIPRLKDSLSLTLKHFLPLAGNLIVPSNPNLGMPEIGYTNGNSVALIFAECNQIDFSYLVAHDARDSCEFHPLIPELKQSSNDDHSSSISSTPVLALQVTLFLNCGMSIGISNHHTAGDASTIFNFMKIWAALHSFKNKGDTEEAAELLVSDSRPFYDRTLIKDTKGLGLNFWEQWRGVLKLENSSISDVMNPLITKTNKVRKTFVITRKDVVKLKNLVSKKRQELVHLSSFTVISAYVWTCLVKCRYATGENVDVEELERFCWAADCRGRWDPPLPANYFGNCLTLCLTAVKNELLVGEDGLPIAAELIGEAIHQRFKDKDALFNGAETWLKDAMSSNWDRIVGVAGSPRYNYYNLDFGWGKPIKFEFISIDKTGAISLSGCRDSEGDVEVGLSLLKPKMDAFTSIFYEGLKAL